jgi:hypothetical protein
MWHDYAIGGRLGPVNYPDADPLPLFEVNREHFESNQVYMPSIHEVIGKFHIAKNARHTSSRSGDTVTVSIDYTNVPSKYRGYVAGMGLRINDAGQPISSVTVDGVDHPAFTDNTVILPAASGTTQQVVVQLGAAPTHPRLSFISKPMSAVSVSGDELTVSWDAAGLFRKACVTGPEGTVLLGAPAYQRAASDDICALVAHTSDVTSFTTTVVDSGNHYFFVDHGDRVIESASIAGDTITLTFPAGDAGSVTLGTGGPPKRVELDGEKVSASWNEGTFEVAIPKEAATLTIQMVTCADADGDGVLDCAGDCDDSDPEVGLCEEDTGCCQAGSRGRDNAVLVLLVALFLVRRRRR